MKTIAGFLLITVTAAGAYAQDGSRVRIAMIRGMELPYEVVDGLAVHAGDIILGTTEEVAAWSSERVQPGKPGNGGPPVARAVPNGYFPSGLLCTWPDGIVPYVIDDNVPRSLKAVILDAIRMWDTQTVLRFVERTPQHDRYQRYTMGSISGARICRQETGPVEQVHQVALGDDLLSLLHNIGHQIGLEHEQQRRDRDHWLTVFRDNIAETPLARDAWHPRPDFGPDITPYDYRSIMHYWFIEPQKQRNHARPYQAETIPPGMPFGATAELSPGDIDAVARMYGHIPSEHVISTNPAGLEIIVDGERMTAPASFSWATGSEHTLEVPSPQFRPGSRFLFGRWSDDGERAHRITATPDTTLYQASFIAQHQVETEARVWCRDPDAACENAGNITVTVSPPSPDGYYTLRTPIEVSATPRPGSSVRLLWWDVQHDYDWGWARAWLHGNASNPAKTFAMPGLTYMAQFGNGPTFRVDSNVDPVRVSVGDRWVDTPALLPVPENVSGATTVSPKPHATSGRAYRHRFRGWSDGGDETHTIEVPRATDTTLKLTLDTEYRLTTHAWPDSRGNQLLVTPSSEDGWYPEGTEIRLLASPKPPARFIGWNGAVSGRDPAAVVTMDDGQFVEAVFDTWSTELQPAVPVEVSLQGRRWEGRVPDFERYYVVPPRDASEIEIEFRTRTATGGEAGLFVAASNLWPDRVHQDTADLVLRAGEVRRMSIARPPRRWPAAYLILVRGAEGSGSRLEGTLVATVREGTVGQNRPPQAVGTLEDRILAVGDGALVMDVARAFRDPDGDPLAYAVVSSAAGVATVHASGSTITVTPMAAGLATITVTATDTAGSSALQRFTTCVTPNNMSATAYRRYLETWHALNGESAEGACTGIGTPTFTDHPIRPGMTPIKAVHFHELRERIAALRTREGLSTVGWTDHMLVAGVTPVKRAHLTELQVALDAVYDSLGRLRPAYSDAVVEAGVTAIKATHIMELRNAVLELESGTGSAP